MYFEPTKKTYHRFPSTNSIHDYNTDYYYPEKTYASGEDIRFNAKATHTISDRKNRIEA